MHSARILEEPAGSLYEGPAILCVVGTSVFPQFDQMR